MLLPRPTFCVIQISSVFVSTIFVRTKKKPCCTYRSLSVFTRAKEENEKKPSVLFFVLGKNAFGASVLPIAAAALVFVPLDLKI